MAPPRRRAVQAEQPCRLGGHAVGRDELLLLADGAEKPERVRPEPDHADRSDAHQPQHGRERHAPALARAVAAEHEEGQQQPGGELDPDPAGQRERCRARPARGRGCARARRAQSQRQRHREQQQRVVVRAADRQHQKHGVQAEEGQSERARAAEAPGGGGGEPDRPEAGECRHGLQRPQAAGRPERRGGVAGKREQRSVGRMLEGPADEAEHRVARGFRREMGVGVQAVQRAHAREGEIAEDVLGDQRRAEQQDHVGRHHRCRKGGQRKRPRGDERHQVAGADRQHQHLEATLPELRADAAQRP